MTVEQLINETGLSPLSVPDPQRQINGVYIGDLLSWVMGRAREGQAWITIMSNVNVIAVASLSDVCCVILAEGVTLEEDIARTALEKGINVLVSKEPIYETAMLLQGVLK